MNVSRYGLTNGLAGALTFRKTRRALADLVLRGKPVEPIALRVILWWGLSFAVLAVYATLRAQMDNVGMPVHGSEWETGLFGSLPTVWLQDHVWSMAPQELEWASIVIHSSWFFVPMIAGLYVSLRRPERVGSFFKWWLAAELVALPLWALIPMRPPWMESSEVTRIIALRFGGDIYDPNPLAALPSLHVAFPLVLALWFCRERWSVPAALMGGYSAIVGLEVVFSGEHYVIDVLGAAALAGFVACVAILNPLGHLSALSSSNSLRRAISERPKKPALELASAAREKERGQALIELALVLPLILVFILVIADFGIALDRRQMVQHAVREGARRGAVGDSITKIKDFTHNESQGLLTVPNISVCYVDATGNGSAGDEGDLVRVKGAYSYKMTIGSGELLSGFGVNAGGFHIDMTPTAESRLSVVVPGAPKC